MKNFSIYSIQLAWQPHTPKMPHTIQFCLIDKNGDVRFIDDIKTAYPQNEISFGTPKALASTPFIAFAGRGNSNLPINELYFLEQIYQRQIKDKNSQKEQKYNKKREILDELNSLHAREEKLINDLASLDK